MGAHFPHGWQPFSWAGKGGNIASRRELVRSCRGRELRLDVKAERTQTKCVCVSVSLCVCPPPRLLIYGEYCSHMEHAQNTLNQLLASREDFRQKVEVLGASRPGPIHPWLFLPIPGLLPVSWKGGDGAVM